MFIAVEYKQTRYCTLVSPTTLLCDARNNMTMYGRFVIKMDF
jgi:hypothetical protein